MEPHEDFSTEKVRNALPCPKCGSRSSSVLYLYSKGKSHTYTKRRRECMDCGELYFTKEILAETLDILQDSIITSVSNSLELLDSDMEIIISKKFKKK